MRLPLCAAFCALSFSLIAAVSSAKAAPNGTWNCKVNGSEWKNSSGGASINAGVITLYSGDDQTEGIYVMTSKPAAVGSFELNDSAQASWSDSTGANHRSKAGSGKLVVSKYMAPEGAVLGKVEGSFSAKFGAGSDKEHTVSDCSFSLPVKNL